MGIIARKLPIGIQSFEKLREENFLYVDKTEYLYRLVHSGLPYFLSRPRRFGKSLFLSTLKAYWEGKKELFHDLYIEKLEEENELAWQAYPVFYFDFNREGYQNRNALKEVLDSHLREWEKVYGCDEPDKPLALRFQNLLMKANETTGKRAVVLVDEYDKPLLDVAEDEALVEYNKAMFKGFFSALKSYDQYLQFVFITGVTKFSKVSIFSDLNQLNDISLSDDYAGVCGLTQKELTIFLPEIQAMANARAISQEECLQKLKNTYDGYCFSPNCQGIYNPYSFLKAMYGKRFGSYWFETGTPAFLVEGLRKKNFDIQSFTSKTLYANERMLSDYRADNQDLIPLMYQTGYLTIVDYDEQKERYTLGFPNDEVKYGFLESLMREFVDDSGAGSGKDIFTISDCIENGDLEGMKNAFIALFASIPYAANEAPFEHYFQTVLYMVFQLLKKFVSCEVHSFTGRVDCIVEARKFVYIFEFKRDQSADEAIKQIEETKYALPYAADARKLYMIGVNFNSTTRRLEEWKVLE